MLVTKNWLYGVGAWSVVLFVASASVAQPPTGGPVSDNPAWYHWIAGYASDYPYITDDTTYPWVRPDTVPVVDTSVPLDWHNPDYWMDYHDGLATMVELPFPPDDRRTWFIGSDENPATTEASVTVLFSQDRDGNNGTTKVGSFAMGGGNADQITTLIIAANLSTTGMESASGNPVIPNRPIRVGRTDSVFEDTSYDEANGFNKALHKIPWGIVKQTTGLVNVDHRNLDDTPSTSSDLLVQSDKDWISGAIYEISGDASLRVGDGMRVGDRGDNTTFNGVTLGHGIFRVRGSNVGEVTVGFQGQVGTGDFTVMSGAARGDVGRISYDGGTTYFSKVNGGKSILEFVLDEGGVTPIDVADELRIGRNNHVSFFAEQPNPVLYGFMRIKLMAPTLAGSGAVGSGDELVLVRADRVNTSITELGGSQLEEGRFMDPDRDLPGVFPHRPLLDGGTVISDFAGATYTWMINYFESMGGADDDVIDDALVLSNLMITGTPGDLLGDGMVGVEDRNALLAAIANPPALLRDLIGGAQHLFDLNADDEINHLDLATFDTYWPLTVGVAGDYNGNGVVDAADYTFWRDRLGQNITLPNSDSADMDGVVTTAEYNFWKSRFGATSGSASLAVGSVPEPGSLLLAALGAIGLAAVRRRGAA